MENSPRREEPRLALIDAPIDSSGAGRGEERAPNALRAAGLLERVAGRDAGVAEARVSNPHRDPATGVVGATEVRRASRAVASRVREVVETGDKPLVLGGDCTLLLGVFSGLSAGTGLWFVDGHADFFDGGSSPTGEAADMDLAILTGHGPAGLLDRGTPLVEPHAVVLLGHRPGRLHPDVACENARLDPAIHAVTAPQLRARGPAGVGAAAAVRLVQRPAWLHLDLDVLDAETFPAVSYPQPLGLDWQELIELTRPLVDSPNLVGISVADFNPDRDPDGTYACQTVQALASLFQRGSAAS